MDGVLPGASADPSLSILVIEKHIAGFGASGRNGGWCSALFPRGTASLERTHGQGRRSRHAARDGRHGRRRSVGWRMPRTSTATTSPEALSNFTRDAVQREAGRGRRGRGGSDYGVDRLELRDETVQARGYGVAPLGEATSRGAGIRRDGRRRVRPGVRSGAAGTSSSAASLAWSSRSESRSPSAARSPRGRPHRVHVSATDAEAASRASSPRKARDHRSRGVRGRNCRGSNAMYFPLYSLMIATEPLPAGGLGGGSASSTGRRSPTTGTCWSTGSARPTTASPSAVGGLGTTGAVRVAPRARPRRHACSGTSNERSAICIPAARGRGDHASLGRSARRAPRLARLGQLQPAHGCGNGGRLCRRRALDHESRRDGRSPTSIRGRDRRR